MIKISLSMFKINKISMSNTEMYGWLIDIKRIKTIEKNYQILDKVRVTRSLIKKKKRLM